MAGTISTTITSTVTLDINPTIVTDAGAVVVASGPALFGPGDSGWTVLNQGTVQTSDVYSAAVLLPAGGLVDNEAGGSIVAGTAIAFEANGGTLVNGGLVAGYVAVSAGGSVVNLASGIIRGDSQVLSMAAPGTLMNAGLMQTGAFGNAVAMEGGLLVNLAGASIGAGFGGVSMGGAGTVVNAGGIGAIEFHSGRPVVLTAGGTVVNEPGGSIYGNYGVEAYGQATITNLGVISGVDIFGDRSGVLLHDDGRIDNSAGATIKGPTGVHLVSGGTLVNAGVVTTDYWGGYPAVQVDSGGQIYNAPGGVIAGSLGSEAVRGGRSVSVVNFGSLIGDSTNGVSLGGDDILDNEAGGLVIGDLGVFVAGGTLINAGTVAGRTNVGGQAVRMSAGLNETIIMHPGAVFTGGVDGGNAVGGTAVSRFELAAGTGAVSGFGSQFVNFDSVVFNPAATWQVAGNAAGIAGGQVFAGFDAGDRIVINGTQASFQSYSSGTLTLSGPQPLQVRFAGSYDAAEFVVQQSAGGTEISLMCFAAGTRIATPAGSRPIEQLRVGDTVLLHDGATAPVVWIGRRQIDCTRHPKPALVWPVRVQAGAFDRHSPSADLYLSPGHCIYAEGVMIPIRCLINGTTVAQSPVMAITYYHLELPRHDVVLAESLPVESYLDVDGRANFAEGGDVFRLFPDFAGLPHDAAFLWESRGAAPLKVAGREVEAVRARLAAAPRPTAASRARRRRG